MRPVTYLRYALALAFVLAGTGWLTTANAQQRTTITEKEQANAADRIGRAEAPGEMLSVPRALAPPAPLTRGGIAVEGFEEGFPPSGWEVVDVSGTGTWATNASSARALNSPTSAFFNDFSGDQDDWLISAPVDLSGFSSPTLYYFENVNFSSFAADQLVQVSTDYDGMGDPSTATWTTVNDLIGPEDAFARTEVDLSAFASETNVYIAFHYVGNFAAEWYVDNVFFSEPLASQVAPECPVSLMPADGSTVDPDPVNGVLLTWAPATSNVADPAYPTGYFVDLGVQNPPADIVNFNAQGANGVFTGPVDYNTTYFYTVRSANAAGGPATCPVLSFTTGDAPAPPPNDNIADATVIESDGTVIGSNVLATAEDPEPDPSCTSGGNVTSVYWTFTAGNAGLVTIDASNSTFDTVLTLHEADGTEIACDDDGGEGTTSLLTDVAVTTGNQYIIRIAGFNATTVGDISFDITGVGMGGGGDQVSLPVTFEDENVDYELTDFGGAVSMLVADPTDATNTVVETLRPAQPPAECFAGTTVADATGFVDPIPFAPDETTMSVRIWSPEAGVRVLFKVEQVGNPGINVETFSFTTVAEEWETVVFDFANPMPNTNPINFENVYNKASIFFDFQCNLPSTATLPATFYWDDVAFGGVIDPPGGDIAFDPNPLVEMLASGETGTETVSIINNTEQEVSFDFSQYSSDAPPPPGTVAPPYGEFAGQALDLAKDEVDARRGDGQSFGAGGPDAFGYRWIDSNEPGGPAFNFVDISGTGYSHRPRRRRCDHGRAPVHVLVLRAGLRPGRDLLERLPDVRHGRRQRFVERSHPNGRGH